MDTTFHPFADCSVSRLVSESASKEETLIDENSCMMEPYSVNLTTHRYDSVIDDVADLFSLRE